MCAGSIVRSVRTKFYNGTFTKMLFTNLYENHTAEFTTRFLTTVEFSK